MTADFTYQQGVAIDPETSQLIGEGTGVFKDVAGGDEQAIYDMLGNPIDAIAVSEIGVTAPFKADLSRGVLSLSSIDLPIISLEAIDSGLQAQAAQVAAEAALALTKAYADDMEFVSGVTEDTRAARDEALDAVAAIGTTASDAATAAAAPAVASAAAAQAAAQTASTEAQNAASSVGAAVAGAVKVTAQTFTAGEQAQARINIGALAPTALGWKYAADYGIDLTGATTHTATQVQAWLDSGYAYASGTIKCSDTIVIKDSIDLSRLTVNYTGTGIAVQVGAGPVLFRKQIHLPMVIATGKTVLGWGQVAGSVGVKIVNAHTCSIDGQRISNFETGLLVRGEGAGCAYNAIRIAHLDNNKIQHDISADATGWSNENSYFIGLFGFNSSEGAITAGTRDIRIQTAASIPNNNTWYGGSVEGNTPEYHLECAGGENRFLQMRWENGVTGCRVYWRVGAFRNSIDRGYAAHLIIETYEAGATSQDILTGQGYRLRQSAASGGVVRVENASGGTAPAVVVMAPGAAVAGAAPGAAYAGSWSANMLALKRDTDAFDRIQIDAQNSRIYLGSGAAAPARYLANLGTTAISLNGGNLVAGTDAALDLGIASNRFRYLRLSAAVQVGTFATGSRPTAATAGAGAMVFDTTLNKPIWSTGSAWVDATGATV